MLRSRSVCTGYLLILLNLTVPEQASAQGLQLYGIGPVNRSMSGAATAAPIEAIGALVYNPATLTSLDDQISIGAEVVNPLGELTSSIPGVGSGTTDSDSGWFAVPSIGVAWQPDPDTPVTLGFGLYGLAGFALNYPADASNPVLFPQTPSATTPTAGFGNIYADISLLQITPSVAMKLNDQLSVAFGPTIMGGRAILSPFIFTATNDANGDSARTYPLGAGTQFSWALGFHAGVYWEDPCGWSFGAAYRSKQQFQNFKYNGTNELGFRDTFELPYDYPRTVSLGTAYTGMERLLLAVDVRYLGWDGTRTRLTNHRTGLARQLEHQSGGPV